MRVRTEEKGERGISSSSRRRREEEKCLPYGRIRTLILCRVKHSTSRCSAVEHAVVIVTAQFAARVFTRNTVVVEQSGRGAALLALADGLEPTFRNTRLGAVPSSSIPL